MAPTLVAGYCNRCHEERDVVRTVPWQDDVCAECGAPDVLVLDGDG